MCWDSVAIDTFRFFGVPLDETESVSDFSRSFHKTLAVFPAHQFGECALIHTDEIESSAQNVAALFGEQVRPRRKCGA